MVCRSQTFRILQSNPNSAKPFYIYKFIITGPDGLKAPGWVQKSIIEKSTLSLIEEQKATDALYLIDHCEPLIYTQFEIKISFSPEALSVFNTDQVVAIQKVTEEIEILLGSEFKRVKVAYDVKIKVLGSPVSDPNLRENAIRWEVQRAINSMLLADVMRDDSFGVTHSKENVGRVFMLKDKAHHRMKELRPHLWRCYGLSTLVQQTPAEPGNEVSLELKLCEETGYTLDEVLVSDFVAKTTGCLRNQGYVRKPYETIEKLLKGLTVEMRTCEQGESIDLISARSVYNVVGISGKEVESDTLVLGSNETSGQMIKTTVKEHFVKEFGKTRLVIKGLRSFLTQQGRWLPMEVCNIRKCQILTETPRLYIHNRDDEKDEGESFIENFMVFCSRTQFLERFGFTLEMKGPYQSGAN